MATNDQKKEGVMKKIYDTVASVIGAGDQLFTMTFPAQPLNYRRFVYDTSNRNSVLTKPYTIAEAEFRLSDQMFNPVTVTSGSNGKKLSNVYNTLINNYVPKINTLAPFFRDRAGLSKFLLQPSGEVDKEGHAISRMELCNMLYEKYLVAKNDWEEEKNRKFDRLKNEDKLDDYARWLSSEGLVNGEKLNNLYNDVIVRGHLHEVMTLMGYINSSSISEELEAVKQKMRHSVRLSLDESMLIYPVQFQPSNWFMAMTPNLQPQDLTMARDVLSSQLREKRKQLRKTKSKLSQLELLNVSKTRIVQLENEVGDKRGQLEEAEGELMEKYGEGVVTAAKTYLNFKSIAAEMAVEEYINSQTYGTFSVVKSEMADLGLLPDGLNTSKKITDTIEKATRSVIETHQANSEVMSKQRELLELQSKAANAKTHEMSSEKLRLKERIEDLEADVKYLGDLVAGTHGEVAKDKIRIQSIKDNVLKGWDSKKAVARKNALNQILEAYPKLDLDKISEPALDSNIHFSIDNNEHLLTIDDGKILTQLENIPKHYDLIPKGSEEAEIDGMFTDVNISIEHDEMSESIQTKSESTDLHASVSFGFGSASASYSHSKASNKMESKFLSSDMEIGFRVAKVSFDRGGWFNPALFDMTKSFSHLAKLKAGAGFSKDKKKYEAAQKLVDGPDFDYMLPSFPVAMVIAKDITIKIKTQEDVSKFSKEVESESMSGNAGLFCFSVSGGKSSQSMAESSFHGHDGSSFYIRIPGPQILGYYQQFVKNDDSTDYVAMISDDKNKDEAPLMKALHEFDMASTNDLSVIQNVDAKLKQMEIMIGNSLNNGNGNGNGNGGTLEKIGEHVN